ncbi:MAG: TIGR02594 family protein [Chitinophagaceae bacterium]|nr:TIGR02594 family protein [Chitinophagaceae bacterium]
MKYDFLKHIGTLPKLVAAGLEYLGLKEIPGPKSNPTIMAMADALNVRRIYTNDDISWCALFMCYLCQKVGKPMNFSSYEILRAASFQNWGWPVRKGDEKLGDIAVFTRPGGNHVGLVIAVSKDKSGKITTLHILGGNQSNAVTITEIAYSRLSHCRRYYATGEPVSAMQYTVDSSGNLSKNEA